MQRVEKRTKKTLMHCRESYNRSLGNCYKPDIIVVSTPERGNYHNHDLVISGVVFALKIYYDFLPFYCHE